MSRLEEIKNEYAKEFDYGDWISFINDQPSWGVEGHMNDICKRYAKECSQASLEKASQSGELKSHYLTCKGDWKEITNGNFQFNSKNYAQKYEINKKSITNHKNIVLL